MGASHVHVTFEKMQTLCDNTKYVLAAGLQDAYSDLFQMFTHCQGAFPVNEVLGPACVQMASPQDNIKLARETDLLS